MKIAPRGRRVFGPDPVAGPPPPHLLSHIGEADHC